MVPKISDFQIDHAGTQKLRIILSYLIAPVLVAPVKPPVRRLTGTFNNQLPWDKQRKMQLCCVPLFSTLIKYANRHGCICPRNRANKVSGARRLYCLSLFLISHSQLGFNWQLYVKMAHCIPQ